jgi:phosphoadenosine phosphosulfate reductase
MKNLTLQNVDAQTVEYFAQQLENSAPQDILRWAAETFGDYLSIVTSFQPTGIVTLHMLQEIAPRTPVITLDTGVLFPETYALIDDLETRFNLNLIRVTPELNLDQQAAQYGDNLWQRDPNQCCNIRKTLPLQNALAGFDAWVTGLRRDQSAKRSTIPVVSWDERYGLVKLCPFANWTEDMIWTYIQAHELPYNELHDNGYPSIGCQFCTKAATDSTDLRSGRWVNQQKTECGIHFDLVSDAAK